MQKGGPSIVDGQLQEQLSPYWEFISLQELDLGEPIGLLRIHIYLPISHLSSFEIII